jgi:hypothetical protein
VNAATHAMVSHPLLRHVAGDVAGAGVAARRMIVLARAAAVLQYCVDSRAPSGNGTPLSGYAAPTYAAASR